MSYRIKRGIQWSLTGSFFVILLFMAGCEKKDTLSAPLLSDYLSIAKGKYIRYRMDSTLLVFYGQKEITVKYQAKDVVEDSLSDNLGRPAWRVVRYISDTNAVTPWKPIATFMLILQRESVEWVENNLRFLKLILPVRAGYSWKGNSFIQTSTLSSEFRFYNDWTYTYDNIDASFTVWNNVPVANTLTVNQRDDIIGTPNDASGYSERTFSQEIYGKGIGMVYKEFLHWEYQPPTDGKPGYKTGYGIKLTMIDHN
ncbi:MAG: hypothetical protein ACKO6K_10825 [Chitinophagaceae bacterium]